MNKFTLCFPYHRLGRIWTISKFCADDFRCRLWVFKCRLHYRLIKINSLILSYSSCPVCLYLPIVPQLSFNPCSQASWLLGCETWQKWPEHIHLPFKENSYLLHFNSIHVWNIMKGFKLILSERFKRLFMSKHSPNENYIPWSSDISLWESIPTDHYSD